MSEAIQLRKLLEEGGCHDITTLGGVSIPITMELLGKLVQVPKDHRPPNNGELMMFANMVIDQKLNPYLKECWLVPLKGTYQPIVAAQSSMRKVMSEPDYEGFVWGWITKDGTRHDQRGKVPFNDIMGAWGEVYRKGRKPFYHEIFLVDYGRSSNQWTMFSKVIRDQAHRYAYADRMGNLNIDSEIPFMDDPDSEPTHDEDIKAKMGSKKVEATLVEEPALNVEAVSGVLKTKPQPNLHVDVSKAVKATEKKLEDLSKPLWLEG